MHLLFLYNRKEHVPSLIRSWSLNFLIISIRCSWHEFINIQSMGMAVMLEEIINYVHSLQNQVEVTLPWKNLVQTFLLFHLVVPSTSMFGLTLFSKPSFSPWSLPLPAVLMTWKISQNLPGRLRCSYINLLNLDQLIFALIINMFNCSWLDNLVTIYMSWCMSKVTDSELSILQGTNSTDDAQETQKWSRERFGEITTCFHSTWSSIWLHFWQLLFVAIKHMDMLPSYHPLS